MSSIRRALIAALFAAGCSSTGPTDTPGGIVAPSAVPTATPTARPTATPLPGGLQVRPGMPPLVNGEANPCLPLCRAEVTTAGPFEVGVRYQTKYFFGGYMTITPKRPWGGGRSEDGTGALDLFLPGEDYGVKFAMDLWPVTDRKRVEGVPNTAAGLVGWLRDNPRYSISEEMTTTVGSIPAIAIDVWNSPDAPSQYEDCLGEPCSDMFAMEQVDGYGGMLGDDVNRLYFADLEFNATRHVLVVLIEGHDRKDLDSRIPAAEELLATVTVPAHAAALESAIVGRWHRKQSCDELRAAFQAAGLLDSHLDWANDLCAETRVPTEHSHFFTADGRFGSYDQDGEQVDDGDYTVVGNELRFPSHGRDLGQGTEIDVGFRIDGNVVTFDVKVPPDCPDPCGKAYFWALSAFASGPWMRSPE